MTLIPSPEDGNGLTVLFSIYICIIYFIQCNMAMISSLTSICCNHWEIICD